MADGNKEFKGKFRVMDAKLKRLNNRDRLVVVIEKGYDAEEHKKLIDHLSDLNDVTITNRGPEQPDLEEQET